MYWYWYHFLSFFSFFLKQGRLEWPRTPYLDQADLELAKIHSLMLPNCWCASPCPVLFCNFKKISVHQICQNIKNGLRSIPITHVTSDRTEIIREYFENWIPISFVGLITRGIPSGSSGSCVGVYGLCSNYVANLLVMCGLKKYESGLNLGPLDI